MLEMDIPIEVVLYAQCTEIFAERKDLEDYWWRDDVDRFEQGRKDERGSHDTMRGNTTLPEKWRGVNRIQGCQALWGDVPSGEDKGLEEEGTRDQSGFDTDLMQEW